MVGFEYTDLKDSAENSYHFLKLSPGLCNPAFTYLSHLHLCKVMTQR